MVAARLVWSHLGARAAGCRPIAGPAAAAHAPDAARTACSPCSSLPGRLLFLTYNGSPVLRSFGDGNHLISVSACAAPRRPASRNRQLSWSPTASLATLGPVARSAAGLFTKGGVDLVDRRRRQGDRLRTCCSPSRIKPVPA